MPEVKITESCYEHVREMISDLLAAWKEDQAIITALKSAYETKCAENQRLTSLCANYREALEAFVADAYEQSHGASDFVVTTCEALEGAKAALQAEKEGETP